MAKESIKYFVEPSSIVRKIWGKSATILFIFAGSAAEFALNKAVDWLYFTGKLPSDPIGRLFSTVRYARAIVFSTMEEANAAIDTMSKIHLSVENKRGYQIPSWAYRDVLFMLIYYSQAAYELLERPMTNKEKDELYDVFYRVGKRMGVSDLPPTYAQWLPIRDRHLKEDLQKSKYTDDLFKQYAKHLGYPRYLVLLEAQKLVVPGEVKKLLDVGEFSWLTAAVPLYKFSRLLKLDGLIKKLLLPPSYQEQIKALDQPAGRAKKKF